jgi:hypothetical protein
VEICSNEPYTPPPPPDWALGMFFIYIYTDYDTVVIENRWDRSTFVFFYTAKKTLLNLMIAENLAVSI